MTIKDLEGVKAELYKAFNEAVAKKTFYHDGASSGHYQLGVLNRTGIGVLGQAIAAIEREQREAQENTPKMLDKLKSA